jgi:hypothetical protein
MSSRAIRPPLTLPDRTKPRFANRWSRLVRWVLGSSRCAEKSSHRDCSIPPTWPSPHWDVDVHRKLLAAPRPPPSIASSWRPASCRRCEDWGGQREPDYGERELRCHLQCGITPTASPASAESSAAMGSFSRSPNHMPNSRKRLDGHLVFGVPWHSGTFEAHSDAIARGSGAFRAARYRE